MPINWDFGLEMYKENICSCMKRSNKRKGSATTYFLKCLFRERGLPGPFEGKEVAHIFKVLHFLHIRIKSQRQIQIIDLTPKKWARDLSG